MDALNVRKGEDTLTYTFHCCVRVDKDQGMGDTIDPEWQDWYQLSPLERWRETEKLRAFYLSVGGSLDPEPDSHSPFDALYPRRPVPADGRTGLRVVWRGGV